MLIIYVNSVLIHFLSFPEGNKFSASHSHSDNFSHQESEVILTIGSTLLIQFMNSYTNT